MKVKKGDIWVLNFPSKEGREQKGIRPALIIAYSEINMISVIPFTTNFSALRFPYTLEVKKSEKNNLESDSIALVFQIQSLDARRFLRKIGEIDESDIKNVDYVIRKYLKLE